MSLGTGSTNDPARNGVPPTDRRKMAGAAVCLLIPIVALMAVPTYAREDPELLGFPFFYWYQLVWVFLCSGFTAAAYKLVISARRTPGARPGSPEADR